MTYSLPETAIDDYEFKFKGVSEFIRSAWITLFIMLLPATALWMR